MQSVSSAGVVYRTRLMEREQAIRFARCLSANSRFQQVRVEESAQAKNPTARFFVAYIPTSLPHQVAMLDREQDARAARAEREGAGYEFCPDRSAGRLFFWCLSVSGEVYETTPETCSCPDHEFRCRPNGLRCKHQLALIAGMGTMTGWQARPALDMDRDFPAD